MSLQDKLAEHRKRWNLDFDPSRQFRELKNRVLTLLMQEFREHYLAMPFLDRKYAFVSGHPMPVHTLAYGIVQVDQTTFYSHVSAAADPPQLADVLQRLFCAMESEGQQITIKQITDAARAIGWALTFSPGVGIAIAQSGREVTLYPSGARFLDEGAVNEPFKWLEAYPLIAARFENTLKIYLEGDKTRFRSLLDDLRWALEQLLRAVLGNDKALENQKETLLRWLRERGVHQEVVNLFNSQLAHFIQYQNEAVKHKEDEYSREEIEFMIYLTGTFLRMLLQLKRS